MYLFIYLFINLFIYLFHHLYSLFFLGGWGGVRERIEVGRGYLVAITESMLQIKSYRWQLQSLRDADTTITLHGFNGTSLHKRVTAALPIFPHWILIMLIAPGYSFNNNTWFLYALFPKGPKRLQYIITPVTGYISMPH